MVTQKGALEFAVVRVQRFEIAVIEYIDFGSYRVKITTVSSVAEIGKPFQEIGI